MSLHTLLGVVFTEKKFVASVTSVSWSVKSASDNPTLCVDVKYVGV